MIMLSRSILDKIDPNFYLNLSFAKDVMSLVDEGTILWYGITYKEYLCKKYNLTNEEFQLCAEEYGIDYYLK